MSEKRRRYITRVALTTQPEMVYRNKGLPVEIRLWVCDKSLDTENPDNALVSIDDHYDPEEKPFGNILPFNAVIKLFLEEDDEIWARSDDVSYMTMTVAPWLGPDSR